jgi:hypothetical protein
LAKVFTLSIEVSEAGLRAVRSMEVQEFLSHSSTRTPQLSPLVEVVLRKLLREADRQARLDEIHTTQEAEARKPKPPSIREVRGRAA